MWVVALAVAAGLAIRAWILASPLGEADSDEAVVGLMARHFLDGELETFFWGSNYGGTLDQMMTAGVFAVAGPSVLALKGVQVCLAALSCVLTWRVGRRTVGDAPARVAALLAWIAPAAYLVFSTKSRGWHWLGLCLALTIVLVCLRLIERPRWQVAAVLGLLLGLAFWTSPALGFVVVPAVAYTVVRRPGVLRLAWAAIPTFLVGASPWIRLNLITDFASLRQLPALEESSYLSRLSGFFVDGLPMALGLKVPYSEQWVGGPVGLAVYPGALVGFVVLVVLVVRHPSRRRLTPLLVLAVAYPFLFAVPTASVYISEPRYVLFLAPVLSLLLAHGLTTRRRQAAALAVALVLSVVGLASLSSWADRNPQNYDLVAGDLGPVLEVLDDRQVDAVWASYWISYRLAFESDERIVAGSLGEDRYPPFQSAVRSDDRPAFVVHRDTPSDDALGPALTERGVAFSAVPAGEFVVYVPERAVDPSELSAAW